MSEKTAAELMAELQRDPEYLARQEEAQEKSRQAAERYRLAASGLLADLAAVGFDVKAVGALRSLGVEYREAIPVLARWLPAVRDVSVKEDIVRSLSVPWAREIAPLLVAELERAADSGLRWAIANALEVVANDEIGDDLLRLAMDRRLGKAREMVVLGLARLKRPGAAEVLVSLLADEETVGHAVIALGKLGARHARAQITTLLQHPKQWIRDEARTALSRLGDDPDERR